MLSLCSLAAESEGCADDARRAPGARKQPEAQRTGVGWGEGEALRGLQPWAKEQGSSGGSHGNGSSFPGASATREEKHENTTGAGNTPGTIASWVCLCCNFG